MNFPLPSGPDAWTDQIIHFCGHSGTFKGDVILTPEAAVVIAAKPVKPGTLIRSNLDDAGWHITDALGGYWNPPKGRFVLPRESIQKLKP